MAGLRAVSFSSAESIFLRPMSLVEWMIWRCRLLESTTSKSTRPRVPMPAAVEIKSQWRAQSAGAYAEHACCFEAALAFHAHFGQDEVARVAGQVVGGQFRQGGFGQGRHGFPFYFGVRWCCFCEALGFAFSRGLKPQLQLLFNVRAKARTLQDCAYLSRPCVQEKARTLQDCAYLSRLCGPFKVVRLTCLLKLVPL